MSEKEVDKITMSDLLEDRRIYRRMFVSGDYPNIYVSSKALVEQNDPELEAMVIDASLISGIFLKSTGKNEVTLKVFFENRNEEMPKTYIIKFNDMDEASWLYLDLFGWLTVDLEDIGPVYLVPDRLREYREREHHTSGEGKPPPPFIIFPKKEKP